MRTPRHCAVSLALLAVSLLAPAFICSNVSSTVGADIAMMTPVVGYEFSIREGSPEIRSVTWTPSSRSSNTRSKRKSSSFFR